MRSCGKLLGLLQTAAKQVSSQYPSCRPAQASGESSVPVKGPTFMARRSESQSSSCSSNCRSPQAKQRTLYTRSRFRSSTYCKGSPAAKLAIPNSSEFCIRPKEFTSNSTSLRSETCRRGVSPALRRDGHGITNEFLCICEAVGGEACQEQDGFRARTNSRPWERTRAA
ncbi:hypothetical protein PYCCODRAFT_1436816 [Trametes coccinea BRFM310]|uniref:Uncharacterized protein n=1 Tax=Trametes coccinea (strain BRFM310) TaxID=1353009 RepID=A0A1Y2IM57_TRAC3|nr:hypothetical protein PYCCODRAFT_1436816 [Trametes coccinea BRFM310]